MITRSKPNWATNATLTSAELNALDTNITNALDKRVGQTDTLESTLTMNAGSLEITGTGDKIVLSGAANIVADVSGSSILANAVGAKIITANGGTFEVGGSTAFPNFTTARSKSIVFCGPIQANNGWTYPTGTYLAASVGGGPCVIEMPTHDGATLSSVDMFYQISTSHFPASKLNMSVQRYNPATDVYSWLSTTSTQFAPGTNATTYYQAGAVVQMTYTCDQFMVVDNSTYRYLLTATEETGVDSVIGNKILGFRANYTAISSMRFA